MIISTFKNGVNGSPEKNLFNVIGQAVQIMALGDFVNLCLVNILTNVSFSNSQKIAIKFTCKSLGTNMFWADIIDSFLLFILYGTFQAIGISEAVEDALTDDQREDILEQICLTAQSVVQGKIDSLQGVIVDYEVPDWKIEIPSYYGYGYGYGYDEFAAPIYGYGYGYENLVENDPNFFDVFDV